MNIEPDWIILTVIVSFPLENKPHVAMIAWTTTPWTLPSNMALCVNPELDYVTVKGMLVIVIRVNVVGLVSN